MQLDVKNGLRVMFGYNAVEDKGRRQSPQTRVKHEDLVLTPKKRGKLQATAEDQVRNLSLVAWMVRKHLDYVSLFHMNFKTDIEPVDTLVNRIFKWHGAPRNLDIAKKFGRDEMFRFYELEKVVAGDAGLLKLDALKLQAIESDLIAKGAGAPEDAGIDKFGLVTNAQQERLQFAICNRGENGKKVVFDHLEPAENVIFDGYWSRFSSQSRGVSPLSTAINTVQDVHEGFEWNLIKMKMHALFGIAILRAADEEGNMGGAAGATKETANATDTATDTNLDLDPRAINLLDLNQGDDVKVLESGTPSRGFVDGSFLFIQIAMLALDIPVTSFDSRRSSFSARIADLNEYEVSTTSKKTKNRYVRQEYSDWVLSQIWNVPALDAVWGLRSVATEAGLTLRDVQEEVEWVSSGSPWLDKFKQIQGDELAISNALDNQVDAARRRGGDVFRNIDKIEQVNKYAADRGVVLATNAGTGGSVDAAINGLIDARLAGEDSDEGDADGGGGESDDSDGSAATGIGKWVN